MLRSVLACVLFAATFGCSVPRTFRAAPTALDSTSEPVPIRLEPVLVWTAKGPHPDHEFGSKVIAVGDIDTDGVRDLITQCHDGYGVSSIFALSGATGATLWELRCPGHRSQQTCWFGTTLCALDDMDGDSISDFAVGDPGGLPFDAREPPFGVWVVSSARGDVLQGWTQGWGAADGYGASLANPGDLDGDGKSDLLARSWTCGGPDVVDAFSTRTGCRLYRASLDKTCGTNFRLDVIPDRNGDGICDFVDWRWPPTSEHASCRVYSGIDGCYLAEQPLDFHALALNSYPPDATFGDVDGDQRDDLVYIPRKSAQTSVPLILSSEDGRVLAELPVISFGVDFLGDLDGDGAVECAPIGWDGECVWVFTLRRP